MYYQGSMLARVFITDMDLSDYELENEGWREKREKEREREDMEKTSIVKME